MGDIHQPLHVGAEYFDAQGRPADPDKDKSTLGDEGGNTFTLELSNEPQRSRGIRKKAFHGFWDCDAVNALFSDLPQTLKKTSFKSKWNHSRDSSSMKWLRMNRRTGGCRRTLTSRNYSQAWADEILPIAREPHEQLQFTNVHPQQEEDRTVAAGEADEKPEPDRISYGQWAANVVREELHKAGWRLADLLEKVL